MNRVRCGGALVALIGMAVVTTACGSDDETSDESQAAVSTTIQGSTLSATNPRTEDPAGKGARNDLSEVDCAPEGDVWSLAGTLTNSGKDDAVYTIQAFVASTEDGNVKGNAVEEIEVKAGDEVPVELAAFHTGPADGVECTVAVNRKPVD